MGQEEGTSERRADGQDVVVVAVAISQCAVSGPALMEYTRGNRVPRRAGCENVGDKAFTPTRDREAHFPIVLWAPMPLQRLRRPLRVPIPLDLINQFLRPSSEKSLVEIISIKILSCTNQAFQKKCGLDKIATIVMARERDGVSGCSIDEMREGTVEARNRSQKGDHPEKTFDRRSAADPSTVDSDDDREE